MALAPIQTLSVGDRSYRYRPIADIDHGDVGGLPYSLKVLLENLARHAGAATVSDDDVPVLAAWDPQPAPPREVGRASGRDRGCQSVKIWVVAGYLNTKLKPQTAIPTH